METESRWNIGVIADDLTSAADAVAPFVALGLQARIGRGRLPRRNGPLLAIDTASRSASISQAARLVGKFTAQLAACDILIKTVDSTLRGHVTAELEAAFNASGRERLVLAPAFPAAGRTTSGGIQLVDNIPVSETVYGQDPIHPARHSVLADLVPASIRSFVLLDATTQEDLDRQIAGLPDPGRILWAGSPGLAQALARHVAPASHNASSVSVVREKILVAVGTANPRSHRQADQIANIPGVTLFHAPRARKTDPLRIVNDIAEAVAKKIREDRIDAVIATGGETIAAILDQLHVQELDVLAELEQGFPLARALLSDGRTLLIALKAGGFGSDDTLQRAISSLRQNDAAPLAVTA